VRVGKLVVIALVSVLALFSGLGQSAYAKHGPKSPKLHFKMKKMGPYGGKYMAPKKQKHPSGYYRSTLTGEMVYGKPKR
jgi:hypothetical protein